MGDAVEDLDQRLREAVSHFWTIRQARASNQDMRDEVSRDRGGRRAVTGGKQMDGFVRLVHDLLVEAGLETTMIYCSSRRENESSDKPTLRKPRRGVPGDVPRWTRTQLPGWFRAEKDWDPLVIVNGTLVAAIEFKSQVGSFGNNFNNRTEEALGNAIDLKAAFREGAFKPLLRPWLGYLMLLEEEPKSTRPVKVIEPHFKVFKEFEGASYANRYEILLTKLVREELYDAACLVLSPSAGGIEGECRQPNPELNLRNFAASLIARASAMTRLHPKPAESVQPETLAETKPDDSDQHE